MKLVVSAFPAVGKSTIFKEAEERGLKPAHVHFNDFTKEYEITVPSGDGVPVFDSDSSKFDKEFFPTNYIQHIKSTLDKLDDVIILVSSHKDVREMLRSQGIDYVLAYPQRELKEEYIRRYKARGNAEGFIGMMESSWNDFIDSCEEDPTDTKIILGEGEFLGQDYLTGNLSQLAGMENMNDDPEWFHKTLKQAISDSNKDSSTKPIDFTARLQRLKERRDPLGIEEEKEVMLDVAILHFPDGSTGNASDQVEIVRYNNEWQTYLAENPDADVSYVPIEIMGGESIGDILHAPNGTTIDMAQPGWHQEYQKACSVVLEEKPDTLITATIVDVNAGPEVTDQQTLPTDNPEVTILNTPEGTIESTLTAEAPEGGIAAVDAASIAEPGPEVSTTSAERNPTVDPDFVEAVVEEGPARTTLIEAQFDMENDIEVLNDVITTYNNTEPGTAGMEQFADGSEMLTLAAGDIKKRYDTDIEPTIAGMESFLGSLKDSLEKIGKMISGKPTRHELALVKKHLWEGWKAFRLYTSEEWVKEQTFINVGKTRVQVPAVFSEINSPSDVKTPLTMINSRVDAVHQKVYKNTIERIRAGVKIFNKFKNSPEDTPVSEGNDLLPIKPDVIKDFIPDTGLDKLDVRFKSVELPVLTKAQIKEVSDLAYLILNHEDHLSDRTGKASSSSIEEENFYRSKFWNKNLATNLSGATVEACTWEYSLDQLLKVEKAYQEKMINVLKFLENWILASVK